MRRAAVLGAVAAIMALAGCGWHGTGTVVQRDYHPSWTSVSSSCHLIGKITTCTPQVHYWPQEWHLVVRDSSGNSHDVQVSEGDYNVHPVGSTFVNGTGS